MNTMVACPRCGFGLLMPPRADYPRCIRCGYEDYSASPKTASFSHASFPDFATAVKGEQRIGLVDAPQWTGVVAECPYCQQPMHVAHNTGQIKGQRRVECPAKHRITLIREAGGEMRWES